MTGVWIVRSGDGWRVLVKVNGVELLGETLYADASDAARKSADALANGRLVAKYIRETP